MNGFVSQLNPTLSSFFRMAIIAGVESAVRIHIERGDNLNARDARGQTPLMLAAARNKPHICKLLLDAGADPLLTDPNGNSALSIANAADAREVVSQLDPVFSNIRQTDSAQDVLPIAMDEVPANDDVICVTESNLDEAPSQPVVPEAAAIAQPPPPEIAELNITLDTRVSEQEKDIGWPSAPMPTLVNLINFDEDATILDLSCWEAEADLSTPDGDPTVLATASKVQNAISEHSPIDVSADWDDFDAFLPERASPLPKADDAEARECLRSLLLRATREGSVPKAAIEDLTLNDDQTLNVDAEALLLMVINDLGAEADERHEYSTNHESFAVHVEPRETSDEEQTLDDALAFIDELQSRRNDPFRLYQREFQHATLLSADEEITLGKAMEQGIQAALDALSGSITGIAAIVEASQLVKSSTKPLRWMSLGTPDDIPESESNLGESLSPKTEGADETGDDNESQDDSDEGSPEGELSEFVAKVERLWTIAQLPGTQSTAVNAMREALGSLGLSGSYLLNLSESGRIAEAEPALAFRRSMQSYKYARDRMAVANLKLVQSIAKKYLYSGMPLEDLVQEGNIGLLTGVERFNWRRGFKFSTYATWWIRQQVGRYVADKSRTIRVPVHIHVKLLKIEHAVRSFEIDHGRTPATSEIARLIDLSPGKVTAYMQIAGEPLPIHELDIDFMIASDARDEYISSDPMDIVSNRELSNVVHKILGTLKLKDEEILRMRFGIGVSDAMTLDEIGIRMGLTRERIRQIESQTIRHLKYPGRLDRLISALNGPNPPGRPKDSEEEDERVLSDSTDVVQVNEFTETPVAKVLGKITREPAGDGTEITGSDCIDSDQSKHLPALSNSVKKVIVEATQLGASVKFDQHGIEKSIWIDFSLARFSPPRPLIHKLIASGFNFWPGKGYWR